MLSINSVVVDTFLIRLGKLPNRVSKKITGSSEMMNTTK